MTARCKLCNNWMERIQKEAMGEQFWCDVCKLEISVNFDKGEIEVDNLGKQTKV